MKNLRYLLALFLFTIISCVDDNVMKPDELVTSEIQLNEIFTTGPDWIELYNSGTTAIDLTGYALADSGTKWPVPSGIVPADGFVTYDCDGLDTNGSTNFKISAGGESVYLYNENDILIDEVTTPDLSITPDNSYSREVDGGDQWVVTAATKGASNNNALSKIKVKINEIKASGSPDWLELYNGGAQEIDLTGYSLADSGSSWVIPNMVISSGGYVVFNCDGLDTNGSANFKISKGGELITLTNSEGTIIDQIDLPDLSAYEERSYGRVSDGSDTWVVMDDSKKAANGTIYEYLNLQASYAIDVPEPSGLAYLNNELFTVSDQTLKVY
ncbi:lamin tail domain-containing protein [Aureibaculum algae]|uniref:Lamin tail domain-containing protein n=1 Tax=Aureibaculum algae TaxID=2584122 RepID=A0A5B7TZD5_9FLAO|nr:lamin tail domain-containing protein [Aureibaculum algae]QCX40147.1 lamin tail domain-containing protein [Aureibaculum algae]